MAAAAERREITLSPDDIEFTESGELFVRSDRVEEALRLAGAERGQPVEAAAQNVEVTVSVTVKF
jgi:hypothetical protein